MPQCNKAAGRFCVVVLFNGNNVLHCINYTSIFVNNECKQSGQIGMGKTLQCKTHRAGVIHIKVRCLWCVELHFLIVSRDDKKNGVYDALAFFFVTWVRRSSLLFCEAYAWPRNMQYFFSNSKLKLKSDVCINKRTNVRRWVVVRGGLNAQGINVWTEPGGPVF